MLSPDLKEVITYKRASKWLFTADSPAPKLQCGCSVWEKLTSTDRHSLSFLHVAKMVSDVANSKYQSLFFILFRKRTIQKGRLGSSSCWKSFRQAYPPSGLAGHTPTHTHRINYFGDFPEATKRLGTSDAMLGTSGRAS